MKIGDLVRPVERPYGWEPRELGIVTEVDCEAGILLVHFYDKAHWIMVPLVEVVSESR